MVEISPLKIIPSNTIRGFSLAERDVVPLIERLGSLPASPADWILTPAVTPDKACKRLLVVNEDLSPIVALATEPVKSLFFIVPYPTTTSSLISCEFSSNFTLISAWFTATISVVIKPT